MGDKAILSGLPVMGGLSNVVNIDANSTQTDTYSEPRIVAGKHVFLTPADAEKLDSLQREEGRGFSVEPNGHVWDRIKAAVQEFLER